MRAYLNGGKRGRYLILAGIAATETAWPGFEERWRRVLIRHNVNWWDTADAMSVDASGEFLIDPRLGWDRTRAETALDELGEVIRDTRAEHFDACTLRADALVMTCVVDMDAYAEAKTRNPRLRSAEAICANACVSSLVTIDEAPDVLCFDQDGGFMKALEEAWRVEGTRTSAWKPRQLETAGDVRNAHLLPGLQAADLLAWSTNDALQRAAEKGSPRANVLGRIPHYYGLEEIERAYPRQKEAR